MYKEVICFWNFTKVIYHDVTDGIHTFGFQFCLEDVVEIINVRSDVHRIGLFCELNMLHLVVSIILILNLSHNLFADIF